MSEKTLADSPDIMFLHRAHREPWAVFDRECRTTDVVAPCCGRVTAANSVLDVRGVPGTVVRGAGHRRPKDQDWLCDGCAHRMVLEPDNDWQMSTLLEKAGAVDAVVIHHRSRERARDLERADHAAGRPHKPQRAWDAAHATVLRDHQRGPKK